MDEGNSDSDVDLEDGSAKKDDVYDADDLPIYIDDSSSGTDDEQTILEASEIVKKFTNRYNKSHENCIKRRAKVIFREKCINLTFECKYFFVEFYLYAI